MEIFRRFASLSHHFNTISKHSSGITKPNYTRFGVELATLLLEALELRAGKLKLTQLQDSPHLLEMEPIRLILTSLK